MKRRSFLVDLGILAAFACLLGWPLAFQGKIPINGDWLLSHFEPWRTEGPPAPPAALEPDDPVITNYPLALEAARQWRSGHWPLWTPGILCGTPLGADGTALPYSPFIPLWIVLPGPWAWSAELFLQLLVAGAGAYLLARSLGCERQAALIGAMAFMGHQGIILWWELRVALGALCWLPWILWAARKARDSSAWLAAQALFVAAVATGGSLQFSAYVLATALFLILCDREGGRRRRPVAAMALGLAIAAVQILPSLALAQLSQRSAERYAGTNVLSPWHLLTFLFPECFGHVTTGDFLGGAYTRPSMVLTHGGYVGLIPLILALVALRSCGMGRTLAIAALALVGGLLSCGVPAIYAGILWLCPQFDWMDHCRLLLVASACLALAAPLGWQVLRRQAPRRLLWLAAGGAALAAGLGWASLRWAGVWEDRGWLPASAGTFWCVHHLPSLLGIGLLLALLSARGRNTAWLAVLLAGADLAWFAQGYNPFTPSGRLAPETPAIAGLVEATRDGSRITGFDPDYRKPEDFWRLFKGDCLLPNTALLYPGLRDLRGKECLFLTRTRRYMEALAGPHHASFLTAVHTGPTASPLLDAAAVSHILSMTPLRPPRFLRIGAPEPGIYRNTRALPRARLVGSARVLEPSLLWGVLEEGTFDPAREALLETGEDATPPLDPAATLSPVRFLRDDPAAVDLETEASGSCLLVLADTWAPGWEATVDCRHAKILH